MSKNTKKKIVSLFLFVSLFLSPTIIITKYYSQIEQDSFLNENIFKNKKNGIFIDIGAHDGISCSNTYFFEKELEWTGICFEPLSSVYQQLKNNRSCICINACVAKEEGLVDFFEVTGYSEMLSGMVKTYEQAHFKRLCNEIKHMGGTCKKIQVPSVNLNNLLKKYNLKNIDYISIDTEGSELEIIKSIDFIAFNVHILSIENPYNKNPIREYMKNQGFKLIKELKWDDIYCNPNYFDTIN